MSSAERYSILGGENETAHCYLQWETGAWPSFDGWAFFMPGGPMDDEHIEAEEAVSIVTLWLKILAYLIAFAAIGITASFAVKWVLFS